MAGRLPEHECSPCDAPPPRIVLPWLFAELMHGRFGVPPEFLRHARRASAFKRTSKRARVGASLLPGV